MKTLLLIILGYFIGVFTTLVHLMRKDKKKLEERLDIHS